jgi:hypothetical protein
MSGQKTYFPIISHGLDRPKKTALLWDRFVHLAVLQKIV